MAGNDPTIIGLGWDKPLDVDWDFQLPELRRQIKLCTPGKSGALASAFDSPDTATISESKNVIDITVGRQHRAWPYAAIQNFGGPTMDHIIRPKKPGGVLSFMWMGSRRFFKKVTMHAWQIKPTDFVGRGVHNWWVKLMQGYGPAYQWASGHHSAGAARLAAPGGRVSE